MHRATSVSAVAVLDLHDVLLEMGVATPAQMNAAGLHRVAMSNPDSTVPLQEQRLDEALLLKLWQIAAGARQVPHIGLVIGQTFNPATLGLLASWLFQCQQVDEALHVFQQHIALMNPSERWTREESATGVMLEISFAADKPYPQAAIERSMSALLRWSEELTGVPVKPSYCEFTCPRPAGTQQYVDIFGENLQFGAPRNCLHLPRSFLQAPIRSANNYVKQLLQARALQALEQLRENGELLGKVRQLIRTNLHAGARIEQVCAALHVSRPTLYRHLKQEGSSFTDLLVEVRKELAYRQIRQGLPVAIVSEQLGFKDVSTFHRAFRRWFGKPPGECRSGPE